jgi:hypothetical protein
MTWLRRKKKPAGLVQSPPGLEAQIHIGNKVFPAHVVQIHRSAAERMSTGFLQCGNCSRVIELRLELVIQYLHQGWPVCCKGTLNGGTMHYHRAEERKRG